MDNEIETSDKINFSFSADSVKEDRKEKLRENWRERIEIPNSELRSQMIQWDQLSFHTTQLNL